MINRIILFMNWDRISELWRRWITICGRYYLTQIVALKTLFFKASLLSTAIPRWKYRFSSDHRSQATSGSVSTWMGDRLGIPSAVDFFLFFSTNSTRLTKPLLPFYSLSLLIINILHFYNSDFSFLTMFNYNSYISPSLQVHISPFSSFIYQTRKLVVNKRLLVL